MAITFDGTDDHINCGTMSDGVLTENGALTISCWIYAVNEGEGSLGRIITRGSGTAGVIFFMAVTMKPRFFVTGSTSLSVIATNNDITANTWEHFIVTWDGSTTATNVHIYKNNSELSYTTQTNMITPTDNSSDSVYIGGNSDTTRTFNGKIAEMAVWNSVISSGDRALLYGSGAPSRGIPRLVSPTTLKGYWPLDDAPNGVTVTTVKDHSNNGVTGTPSGSPVGYTNPLRSTYGNMIGVF